MRLWTEHTAHSWSDWGDAHRPPSSWSQGPPRVVSQSQCRSPFSPMIAWLSRLRKKECSITADLTHLGHSLFEPLLSGRLFRITESRLKNIIFHRAVASRLMITDNYLLLCSCTVYGLHICCLSAAAQHTFLLAPIHLFIGWFWIAEMPLEVSLYLYNDNKVYPVLFWWKSSNRCILKKKTLKKKQTKQNSNPVSILWGVGGGSSGFGTRCMDIQWIWKTSGVSCSGI